MARLLTSGFEIGEKSSAGANIVDVDYSTSTGADYQIQTSVFRSGASAVERTAAATSNFVTNWTTGSGVADRTYYARVYYLINGTATATGIVMAFIDSAATTLCRISINSSNQLILMDAAGATVGSVSSALSADTWYKVELAMKQGTSASTDYLEGRLNGVSFASSSTNNSVTVNPIGLRYGSSTAIGRLSYYDDLAVNDDQGSDQNSWPGDGKVVLLKPIADQSVGRWAGGAGALSNLFAAVDNTPPTGTASETDSTQIETFMPGNNNTDEYRANLTTYASAGIDPFDIITVLHPVINHGEDSATGTKTGSFGLQSNPTQTYVAFTYGDDAGALGTWPTNWRWQLGSPVYNPSPTTSASPVLGVRKTDATSEVVSVDFMGVYAEYQDGSPTSANWFTTL